MKIYLDVLLCYASNIFTYSKYKTIKRIVKKNKQVNYLYNIY